VSESFGLLNCLEVSHGKLMHIAPKKFLDLQELSEKSRIASNSSNTLGHCLLSLTDKMVSKFCWILPDPNYRYDKASLAL
jgi:hypothetical protein